MRLLADRASDGITVRLFWDEAATAVADIVLNTRTGARVSPTSSTLRVTERSTPSITRTRI
jgi:hypothetical protein